MISWKNFCGLRGILKAIVCICYMDFTSLCSFLAQPEQIEDCVSYSSLTRSYFQKLFIFNINKWNNLPCLFISTIPPPLHVCKTLHQPNKIQCVVFPTVTQNTYSCSSPAMQVCCFWLWVVNALWQLTIIFHRRTLSHPHSLPRQFPLAKLPLSFSHIFPILFFWFPLIQHNYPVFWNTKPAHYL